MATLTRLARKYKVHELLQRRASFFQDVPLVDSYPFFRLYLMEWYPFFSMYLWWIHTLFSWCTSDGVYAPCIYLHARWELLGDSGLLLSLRDIFWALTPLFVDFEACSATLRNPREMKVQSAAHSKGRCFRQPVCVLQWWSPHRRQTSSSSHSSAGWGTPCGCQHTNTLLQLWVTLNR